jgi:hypothetical protein
MKYVPRLVLLVIILIDWIAALTLHFQISSEEMKNKGSAGHFQVSVVYFWYMRMLWIECSEHVAM